MTAHRTLFADGPIAGQTVLVTGGAGAVGNAAVQLAKWGGAAVIATVSSDEKAAEAGQAGADLVLNYRTDDVAERVLAFTSGAGVDRIVEVDFGGNLAVSERVLREAGTISPYSSSIREPELPYRALQQRNARIQFVLMYSMPESAKAQAIADITAALAVGQLRHTIGARFPLEQTARAHEAQESGRIIGNIVVQTDA
jgi:NADPH2:quinone reductase